MVDDQGKEVPPGELGNLVVKPGWPSMMKEIWKNKAKYDEYFRIPGWYLSGDSAFKDADGFLTGTDQKLWEGTATLQYKPAPSLITRVEFRYDKSNENTFQSGGRVANHQETLATEVIFLF